MLKYFLLFCCLSSVSHAGVMHFYYPDDKTPIIGICNEKNEEVQLLIKGHVYSVKEVNHMGNCPKCD
jgi:hypothetical protein